MFCDVFCNVACVFHARVRWDYWDYWEAFVKIVQITEIKYSGANEQFDACFSIIIRLKYSQSLQKVSCKSWPKKLVHQMPAVFLAITMSTKRVSSPLQLCCGVCCPRNDNHMIIETVMIHNNDIFNPTLFLLAVNDH